MDVNLDIENYEVGGKKKKQTLCIFNCNIILKFFFCTFDNYFREILLCFFSIWKCSHDSRDVVVICSLKQF